MVHGKHTFDLRARPHWFPQLGTKRIVAGYRAQPLGRDLGPGPGQMLVGLGGQEHPRPALYTLQRTLTLTQPWACLSLVPQDQVGGGGGPVWLLQFLWGAPVLAGGADSPVPVTAAPG